MFFESIIFLIIIFFVIYLPGRFILKILPSKFTSFVVTFFLSISLGTALFLLSTYLLSWVGIAIFYNVIIFVIAIFSLKPALLELRENVRFNKINYIELTILIAGVLAIEYLSAGSGIELKNGSLQFFPSERDSINHLSVIAGMLHNFPPQLYSFAGLPMRGYHFFYDFLAAEFISFYQLNLYDVVFRFLPFFLSTIYGLSFIALARFLKMDKTTSAFLLYLAFFTTDLIFIVPLILHRKSLFYNDGINPLILNYIDPSVLLAIALLFAFYILVFDQNKRSIFLTGLLLGVLPEVKIYAAMLAYISLFLIAVITLFKKKDIYYFQVLVLSAIISAIVFLPFNYGTASPLFTPFALYDHFIQGFAMYNNMPWYLQFQVYLQHNNIPRIILFALLTASLYYLPTLGIRIISIVNIRKMFSKNFYTLQNLFLLFFVISSLILASFMTENIDIFNNVQFLWFAYIILIIPTAYACNQITLYLKKIRLLTTFILFIVLFLLNYPTLYGIYTNYLHPSYIADSSLVTVTSYIRANTPQNDSTMVLNQVKNVNSYADLYGTPLVSALAQHPVYYEPVTLPFKNALNVQQERQHTIVQITNLLTSCQNIKVTQIQLKTILKNTKVNYLMTFPQTNQASTCLNNISYMQKVKQDGGYSLYKIL